MNSIIVNRISKNYNSKPVMQSFCAAFPKGSVTCITGPSGCGKTTLLRIIAGLEHPDSGSVEGVPGKVSFVFQEDRLCEDFSAVSNIRLVTGRRMPKNEILSHLRETGLDENPEKPVRDYSGGMKRRVSIARAICYGADLILLDEPFKGLDPALRIRAMDYVKKHSEGKTVICVTHDSEEAEYLGGRTIDMGSGK